MSVPEPRYPTCRLPEFVQVEPGPSIVTCPLEPELNPIYPPVSDTSPPLSIVSVPEFPTTISNELFNVEPAPVTVTEPVEPKLKPSRVLVLETLAAASIVSVPSPELPTNSSP